MGVASATIILCVTSEAGHVQFPRLCLPTRMG